MRAGGERLEALRERAGVRGWECHEEELAVSKERARRQEAAHELVRGRLQRAGEARRIAEVLESKRTQVRPKSPAAGKRALSKSPTNAFVGQEAALKEQHLALEAEARELKSSLEHLVRTQRAQAAAAKQEKAQVGRIRFALSLVLLLLVLL